MSEQSEIIARCREEVTANPDDASTVFALGTALWPAGQREEALRHLERAVQLDPLHVDGRNNLGNALLELGRYQEAIAHYRVALALRPNGAELHYNLGNALLAANQPATAEASFRAAIEIRPEHAGARNNLGNALRNQGRHREALEQYEVALAVQPDYCGTLTNIGLALLALYRPDEALKWLRRAVERDRGQAQAQFGEAIALLTLGNYRDGWIAYESRWLDPKFRENERKFADLPWLGRESVAGRTILLHAEQGLGDTIQFVRYAPLLRRRGARVVLDVQAPLVSLLRDLADAVIAQGDALPPYDLHCPLLSLPLAFGTELATIPAGIPYLQADPAKRAIWAARLGTRTRLRVGIAWSGAAYHPGDASRSIPAALFLAPLAAVGVELHVIQKDIRAGDAAAVAAVRGLRMHADLLHDLTETAALISELDLVISADTSVAHLAGALGRPVWIMVAADFRWMRHRTDSPWYPTARLFRQTARGAWPPVIAEVAAALAVAAQAAAEPSPEIDAFFARDVRPGGPLPPHKR
jgi:tetratricopeptide (TPR) repeat protein